MTSFRVERWRDLKQICEFPTQKARGKGFGLLAGRRGRSGLKVGHTIDSGGEILPFARPMNVCLTVPSVPNLCHNLRKCPVRSMSKIIQGNPYRKRVEFIMENYIPLLTGSNHYITLSTQISPSFKFGGFVTLCIHF